MNESNIEVDGLETILEIIDKEFGGWPILDGPSWNSSNFNLTNLLLKLRQYDDGIFFSVNTATNQENSSIYDIEVNRRRVFFFSEFNDVSFSSVKEPSVFRKVIIITMKRILHWLIDNS